MKTHYTAAEIEYLRSRWLTPRGQEILESVLATACSEDDDWSDEIKAGAFPGSPIARFPDFYTDLRGIDFSGRDLTSGIFCFADVSFGDFSGCQLAKSSFQCGLLDGADFHGSNMIEADLLQISAMGADFSNCRDLQ